jgi:hypothetical protein
VAQNELNIMTIRVGYSPNNVDEHFVSFPSVNKKPISPPPFFFEELLRLV